MADAARIALGIGVLCLYVLAFNRLLWRRLYNLAADPRLNHEIDVVPGVRGDECAALVEHFFASRRS